MDWVPDGCIEASIPGKWDFAAKGPWLGGKITRNLSDGTDPKTGYHFVDLEKRAEDCGSVRELMELYKQTLNYFGLQVKRSICGDENSYTAGHQRIPFIPGI